MLNQLSFSHLFSIVKLRQSLVDFLRCIVCDAVLGGLNEKISDEDRSGRCAEIFSLSHECEHTCESFCNACDENCLDIYRTAHDRVPVIANLIRSIREYRKASGEQHDSRVRTPVLNRSQIDTEKEDALSYTPPL